MERLEEVRRELEDPAVWTKPERAQELGRERARLTADTGEIDRTTKGIADAAELLELAEGEGDEAAARDIDSDAQRLEGEVRRLELKRMFTGKMDSHNAFLDIQAGAGGTEAQDWAQMLLRMYLRWAERHRFRTEMYDYSEGEEAGLKSATIEITGRYAYGYLRSEIGTHRLIRLSHFDAAHRRHTSFAKVEVMPDIEDTIEITIRPEDIEVDTYRSTGAGGQHVNKTDSAVRMRHIPTGIVVTCQNERSQFQNREVALKLLKVRLYELEQKKHEEATARLKGEHVQADFGTQIRSVTVHPYNIVKDHRTNYETSDTEGYLDGNVDPFIHAYLQEKTAGVIA